MPLESFKKGMIRYYLYFKRTALFLVNRLLEARKPSYSRWATTVLKGDDGDSDWVGSNGGLGDLRHALVLET